MLPNIVSRWTIKETDLLTALRGFLLPGEQYCSVEAADREDFNSSVRGKSGSRRIQERSSAVEKRGSSNFTSAEML